MTTFTLKDGTPHREPFLAAIPCPEERMPANCRKAVKLAEQNGWTWGCTYAIGYGLNKIEDGQEIHSVVFYALRDRCWIGASWHSKPGQEAMGFNSAFCKQSDGKGMVRILSSQLFEELMEPIAKLARQT